MTEVGNPVVVRANEDPESIEGRLMRGSRMLVENSKEDSPIIGYLHIAIYGDGAYARGWQVPEDHPIIGKSLFVAYIKEIISRELTGQMAAEDYAMEYLG